MRKIKKNDDVLVIAGDDKGRQGKVLRVFSNSKVLVEGVNVVKKHQKPNPQRGVQGGIIEKEMPIHTSNVALLNPVTAKADRVGFKEVKGEKVRYFKSNDEIVDV